MDTIELWISEAKVSIESENVVWLVCSSCGALTTEQDEQCPRCGELFDD